MAFFFQSKIWSALLFFLFGLDLYLLLISMQPSNEVLSVPKPVKRYEPPVQFEPEPEPELQPEPIPITKIPFQDFPLAFIPTEEPIRPTQPNTIAFITFLKESQMDEQFSKVRTWAKSISEFVPGATRIIFAFGLSEQSKRKFRSIESGLVELHEFNPEDYHNKGNLNDLRKETFPWRILALDSVLPHYGNVIHLDLSKQVSKAISPLLDILLDIGVYSSSSNLGVTSGVPEAFWEYIGESKIFYSKVKVCEFSLFGLNQKVYRGVIAPFAQCVLEPDCVSLNSYHSEGLRDQVLFTLFLQFYFGKETCGSKFQIESIFTENKGSADENFIFQENPFARKNKQLLSQEEEGPFWGKGALSGSRSQSLGTAKDRTRSLLSQAPHAWKGTLPMETTIFDIVPWLSSLLPAHNGIRFLCTGGCVGKMAWATAHFLGEESMITLVNDLMPPELDALIPSRETKTILSQVSEESSPPQVLRSFSYPGRRNPNMYSADYIAGRPIWEHFKVTNLHFNFIYVDADFLDSSITTFMIDGLLNQAPWLVIFDAGPVSNPKKEKTATAVKTLSDARKGSSRIGFAQIKGLDLQDHLFAFASSLEISRYFRLEGIQTGRDL